MSLKISKKGGCIVHLQFNTYHMVQRLWKSVQQILRYFGSEWTSLVQNKIGCHGNIPWDIEKNFRSIIYTQNPFIRIKIAKIAHGLCFAYDTKFIAMATSLEESEKLDQIRTRGSALAEGPRDTIVSRNSATTKHPIWKLESRAYRVALFSHFYTLQECDRHTHTDRQTDGQIHDDGMYRA